MCSWTWLLSGRKKRGCRFVRHEPSVLAAYSTYKDLFLNFLKFFKNFSKKCLTNYTGSCIIMKCFAIATNTKQDLRCGLLVKWLRRRPLTAKTGVRLPYKLFCVIIDSKEWTLCPLFRFCNIIIV